tara:strand:+ start:1651 stop:1902 length:252 start_codon:yes stop_codon:yes gene_type:complete
MFWFGKDKPPPPRVARVLLLEKRRRKGSPPGGMELKASVMPLPQILLLSKEEYSRFTGREVVGHFFRVHFFPYQLGGFVSLCF